MSINQAGFAPLVDAPRRWDFLAGLMLQLGLKSFVEVGCKEGRTTGHILKTVPFSNVIAVDPWMQQEASADPTKETYEKWDFSKIEREFWENVGDANEDRCEMLRTTSLDAAHALSKRNFGMFKADIVFIDALHDYENVNQDIRMWWPLVRDRGILAGHDFNHKWPGVQRAVAENFNLLRVGVGPDSVWFVAKAKELDGE